jgi:hypothetical protein
MFGDQQPLPAQVALNPRYQFSLRGMLWLMLAACVALTIASLCRGSEYFGALASPWTWATLALIAASWILNRRIGNRRRLFLVSMMLYGISLLVPAMFIDEPPDNIAFGFHFWWISVAGSWGSVHDWFYPPPPHWLNISLGVCIPMACFLGLMANLAVPASWIAGYTAYLKRRRAVLAHLLAWGSVAAMVSSIVLLSCAIPVPVLLPGYGLWVASALTLALRS